jgi:hypothetical protein
MPDSMIRLFNDPTFKKSDLKTQEEVDMYNKHVNNKNRIMRDKNASISDILRYSQ